MELMQKSVLFAPNTTSSSSPLSKFFDALRLDIPWQIAWIVGVGVMIVVVVSMARFVRKAPSELVVVSEKTVSEVTKAIVPVVYHHKPLKKPSEAKKRFVVAQEIIRLSLIMFPLFIVLVLKVPAETSSQVSAGIVMSVLVSISLFWFMVYQVYHTIAISRHRHSKKSEIK